MISRRSILPAPLAALAQNRFRVAVIGTEHGHVNGFLNAAKRREDVEVIGPIPFEQREDFKPGQAEAVACFTSTDRHLELARFCAKRRLPMMMEKPLAVNNEAAREIAKLSQEAGVPFFVNFETTWYASHAAQQRFLAGEGNAGKIRKMVAMHGHAGPKEIGVGPEFLAWLNDPVRNGAGALFDFGCYGANLMTWLLGNERPQRVTAITRQHKPGTYGRVDDEATIIVDYREAQGIIQASWNWPYSRKDLEVYGERGYAHAIGGNQLRVRKAGERAEALVTPEPLPAEEADAISYLMAVVRNGKKPAGLSSLENNLIATEILVAARDSARRQR